MAIQIEYTDTFGGEANYCWVRRAYIKGNPSDRAIVRRAKAWAGMTGLRCDTSTHGDMLEIRPRNVCQIIFAAYCDDEYVQGDNLTPRGDPMPNIGHLKRFVHINRGNLFVNVLSEYDGMTDGMRDVADGFIAARHAPCADNTLEVNGIWIVGRSRDFVDDYDDGKYIGYIVCNSCARFIVAVKKRK